MGEASTQLEAYRAELTGYCYRMLGSAFEAEDAVQDTMLRAWRGLDRFEGRAALRSWIYRIATNVCLDMIGSAQRRARPMEFGSPWSGATEVPADPLPDEVWVGPVPDDRLLPAGSDPAEVAVVRESVRLAFVAALQHLPPKQRSVLILRDVLAWSAAEVAGLLDLSVAAVNSALQRARATLATADIESDVRRPMDNEQNALLARYVEAFEAFDLTALVELLRDDAVLSMPPLAMWFRGPAEITAWMSGAGRGCRGSRLLPTVASGLPAYGQYRPSGSGSGHDAWSVLVLEITRGQIRGITNFLDTTRLFPIFGLPPHLPAGARITNGQPS